MEWNGQRYDQRRKRVQERCITILLNSKILLLFTGTGLRVAHVFEGGMLFTGGGRGVAYV